MNIYAIEADAEKKILAVQIPNTDGGLPAVLKKKKVIIIDWNGKDAQKELDRLFGRK